MRILFVLVLCGLLTGCMLGGSRPACLSYLKDGQCRAPEEYYRTVAACREQFKPGNKPAVEFCIRDQGWRIGKCEVCNQ